MPRIAALVLAAGLGQRFGGAKLDAEIGGQSVLGHVLDRTDHPAIAQVFVVARDPLRALAGYNARIVRPPVAPVGIGDSIAAGVRAVGAAGDFDGLLLLLGDMPFIPGTLIDAMAAALSDPGQVIVPVHRGRRGHPVLFGQSAFAALTHLSGDVGARQVIDQARHLVSIACDDAAILFDIDRPADLAAATARFASDR